MTDHVLRTLLLSLRYPNRASYYDDWHDAFTASPLFDCTAVNILDASTSSLAQQIDAYDAIILLHSCNSDTLDYFAPLAPVLGQRRKGRLLSFVGNEFNSPYVSTPERVRLLKVARADLVATQLLREAGEYLYAGTDARVISVPHALNPAVFRPGPRHELRHWDIGVKGYRYPGFLGDEDRNRMLATLSRVAAGLGLAIDISENARLNRADWAGFLSDCRGTVSTETGSWYISPNDDLITELKHFLQSKRSGLTIRNDSFVRRAARRLPSSVKAILWSVAEKGPIKFEVLEDFKVSFDELDERFFRHTPRAPAYGKAISSRHFDAIGTKTCQVMLRGRYNDILGPDEHYIAVDENFGNMHAALELFRDSAARNRIVDAAYDLAMTQHTYAHRAAQVHQAITDL